MEVYCLNVMGVHVVYNGCRKSVLPTGQTSFEGGFVLLVKAIHDCVGYD